MEQSLKTGNCLKYDWDFIVSSREITEHANTLVCAYPSDLDSGLVNKLLQFRSIVLAQTDKSPLEHASDHIEVWPAVCLP